MPARPGVRRKDHHEDEERDHRRDQVDRAANRVRRGQGGPREGEASNEVPAGDDHLAATGDRPLQRREERDADDEVADEVVNTAARLQKQTEDQEVDDRVEHRLGDEPGVAQEGAPLRAQGLGPGVGPDEVPSLPELAYVGHQRRAPAHRVELAELDDADTDLRAAAPERLPIGPRGPGRPAHTSSL